MVYPWQILQDNKTHWRTARVLYFEQGTCFQVDISSLSRYIHSTNLLDSLAPLQTLMDSGFPLCTRYTALQSTQILLDKPR